MKLLRKKRISSTLIALSAILLCLGIFLAYLVYYSADDLRYDARLINEAGIVRGSIQRITKLVLSEPSNHQSAFIIHRNINRLIDRFLEMGLQNSDRFKERELHTGILRLADRWQKLEVTLRTYQEGLHEELEKTIVEQSEQCWESANGVVHMAQFVTEDKVNEISRLFYLVLLLILLTAILLILLLMVSVRRKLEHQSLRDPLTGLFNRRAYDNGIESEIARVNRYNLPISIILLDIDYFKNVNDTFGHKVGDAALVELANLISSSIRKSDSVYRFGGEEFVIISPEKGVEGAYQLAEKIRVTIEQHDFISVDKMTVSLGVAELSQGITKENLYHNADTALYKAKHNGRNRTELYVGDPQSF